MLRDKILIALFVLVYFVPTSLFAQSRALRNQIEAYIDSVPSKNMNIGSLSVKNITNNPPTKVVRIETRSNFLGFPFRMESVDTIKAGLAQLVNAEFPNYKIDLFVEDKRVESLIPNFYQTKKDTSRIVLKSDKQPSNVVMKQSYYDDTHGSKSLIGRNIALWQSHGVYYKQQEDRWIWQRARLFTTVEDKFTASFVVPYLLPMLENAGANVFLPRERDFQTNEVVVDNDLVYNNSSFVESTATRGYVEESKGYYEYGDGFRTGLQSGFAARREFYKDTENPFEEGTYRKIETSDTMSAWFEWVPDIPEEGDYSVWVSYKAVSESVGDAHYIVYHSDGNTSFKVNQTMGGSTWIYLGKFHFKKGENRDIGKVVLSNESSQKGVLTADAVRFGGGMGNVSRRMSTEKDLRRYKNKNPNKNPKLISYYPKEEYTHSGVARFWEGSRYWLQWAGAPDSVYSFMMGLNDYTDDFSSRGLWVNWLNQGSVNSPKTEGLGIPLDLALAFHSDAGVEPQKIVGTLGIYTTQMSSNAKMEVFPNGKSRDMSRDLTDLVLTSVCDDIEKTCNSRWVRRGMWNKSYSECRRPEVPSMILELLSHQNLEDMSYGLDPRFKFIVSRAIYKGILRFVYEAYDLGDYVVQPLPIRSFATQLHGKDSVVVSWRPRADRIEQTAKPDYYVLYTSINGGWDNGIVVRDTVLRLKIENDVIYSYKVQAVNAGGRSMDSEILSVCSRSNSFDNVLIINGFDRVGAPQALQIDSLTGGFYETADMGVAHGYDLQYSGKQYEFNMKDPWVTDDAPGWGASHSDMDQTLVVGNTFNYPYLHGKSIYNAGYSFSSTSKAALEDSTVNILDYNIVDLILGEQKHVRGVDDMYACDNKTFSVHLQGILSKYLDAKKSLFVSGAYLTSGMMGKSDREFVKNKLKVDYSTKNASVKGQVKAVYAPNIQFMGEYLYSNTLNDSIYCVENPDALLPINKESFVFLRYSDNNKGAAVAYRKDYGVITSAIPFEVILTQEARDLMMEQILRFLKVMPNCQ